MQKKFKEDICMFSYFVKPRSLSMVVLDRSIHFGKGMRSMCTILIRKLGSKCYVENPGPQGIPRALKIVL
jgi:hypothetical protein